MIKQNKLIPNHIKGRIAIIGSTHSGKTYRLKELLARSTNSSVIFPAYHLAEAAELSNMNTNLFLHSENFKTELS